MTSHKKHVGQLVVRGMFAAAKLIFAAGRTYEQHQHQIHTVGKFKSLFVRRPPAPPQH